MSDYIDANPKEFSGRRIVELGAGAGLPSILATRANAKKVNTGCYGKTYVNI